MENKWELSIMNLTSDIFMEAFFGCRVDPNAMYRCLKGSWHKGRFVLCVKLTQRIKLKHEQAHKPDIIKTFVRPLKGNFALICFHCKWEKK